MSRGERNNVKSFLTVIGTLVLLAVAVFCVYGFLATFEPTDKPAMFLTFRIGYAAVGLGCMGGVLMAIVNAAHR